MDMKSMSVAFRILFIWFWLVAPPPRITGMSTLLIISCVASISGFLSLFSRVKNCGERGRVIWRLSAPCFSSYWHIWMVSSRVIPLVVPSNAFRRQFI
ncbi:MAG: hypothetical protein UH242_09160 [Methanobrevibacter sp.]|nr:hypothetical protein [Methanobrevibacter sp.]